MATHALTYLSTGVLDTAFDSQVYQLLLKLSAHFELSHFCFEPFGTWGLSQRRQKEISVRQQVPISSIRAVPFVGRPSLSVDGWRLAPFFRSSQDGKAQRIINARGYVNGFRALAAISSHRSRFRLITDYRGVSWDELSHGPKSPWRSWVDRFRSSEALKLERQVGLESDAITCVSREFSVWLQDQHGIPGDKITVIPSTVNTGLFRFDAALRASLRQELNIQNRLVCVYSGSMSLWQRPVETLQLFSRIRQKHSEAFLLFLTHHTGRATEMLSELLPARSWQVRYVPHHEVPSYLCAADLAIMLRDVSPTNRVASPIKFSEYLCCGLPVVITRGIGDTERHLAAMGVGKVLPDMNTTPDDATQLLLQDDRRLQLASTAECSFGLESNLERMIKQVYEVAV